MALERPVEDQLSPIRIQRMQMEDVDQVARLDIKCFPTPWSLSAYITEVHNHSAYYIVARLGERVIAYAGEWLIMDEAHVTTIGVDPEFRGRKIGERMFLELMEEAIRRGVNRATLEVRKHNYVAQGLYRKYGFNVVAVRKGYYSNNNEDALVMWGEDLQAHCYQSLLSDLREQLEGMA